VQTDNEETKRAKAAVLGLRLRAAGKTNAEAVAAIARKIGLVLTVRQLTPMLARLEASHEHDVRDLEICRRLGAGERPLDIARDIAMSLAHVESLAREICE